MSTQCSRKITAVAVAAALQTGSLAAMAQQGELLVLEEVVVTAQKREESVQDVPFTVNALQGDALAEMQITSFEDLESISPGRDMRNIDGRAGSIALRGVDYSPHSAAAQAVVVLLTGVLGAAGGAWFAARRKGGSLPPRGSDQSPADRARQIQVLLESWWFSVKGSSRGEALHQEMEALRKDLEAVRFAPGRADHTDTVSDLEERFRILVRRRR